jgi:methionyl-tRNA formyltransferase
MSGEQETGVTVMLMDEGEDTGDIILQEKMDIAISDSAELLSQKLAHLAAGLIRKTLQLAQEISMLPRQPQDHSKASYAPKLKKEDGLIDWKKSALEIHNLIRGTMPWPGAYTTFGENMHLKIWESQPLESSHPCTLPGAITDILPDVGIVAATGDMELLITTVQPANKSRMTARDFVNGYRVKVGDSFS